MLISDYDSKVKLKRSTFKSKVVINGETNRKVSAYAKYYLTKSSRLLDHSLVDREVNGSVALVIRRELLINTLTKLLI